MGLVSLYLFTLLGGLAAGAYVFETCLRRNREGARPWLIPVVVVVLFAVGLIAAATHIHSIPRAFESLFSGTINFGAGMIWEVIAAGVFLILALVDMIIVLVKKASPYVLRLITAIVGVICIILMGTAYINVYGNVVWTNAPATILTFLAGGLSVGLSLYALLASADYADKSLRYTSIAMNVVLAVGFCLEIAAFSGAGFSIVSQVAGLIVAPVASIVIVALSSKIKNKNLVALLVFAVSIIGVAVARYAFYATCTVM